MLNRPFRGANNYSSMDGQIYMGTRRREIRWQYGGYIVQAFWWQSEQLV